MRTKPPYEGLVRIFIQLNMSYLHGGGARALYARTVTATCLQQGGDLSEESIHVVHNSDI